MKLKRKTSVVFATIIVPGIESRCNICINKCLLCTRPRDSL